MELELRNLVELIISLLIGLIGTLIQVGLFGFLMNIPIPYMMSNTIDVHLDHDGSPRLLSSPLANNLVLLLGFGIQHSGMIRGPVNYLQRLFFSEENTRVFFVAMTCIYMRFFLSFWEPMPHPIWDVQQQQLIVLVYVFNLTSWFLFSVSTLTLDPWALLGIRAHLDKVFKRKKKEVQFVTTGLYALMRHPIYTFFLSAIWITPTMTTGHLLFCVGMTAYTLIAVAHFEEPDLVRDIGQKYVEYMKTTPRYIPNFTQYFTAARTAKD